MTRKGHHPARARRVELRAINRAAARILLRAENTNGRRVEVPLPLPADHDDAQSNKLAVSLPETGDNLANRSRSVTDCEKRSQVATAEGHPP